MIALAGLTACAAAPLAACDRAAAVDGGGRQLIRVENDRRLALECEGRGEPTIVLEAGYASISATWRPVEALLALSNRVCAYDRAGMGFSDASSRPTTPANVVDDLHRLVKAAGIKTPFVLVGHSRGGLYATLYALTYRSDLAGMVLVDPAFAQNSAERMAISPSERDYIKAGIARTRAGIVNCGKLAAADALSPSQPRGCFSVSDTDTPAVRAETVRQGLSPAHYRALLSEFDADLADTDKARVIRAERTSKHPLGDLPLVVLTSDRPMQTRGAAGDIAAADALWKHGHDRLAADSSVGRAAIVRGAGHMIQLDRPQAVADAVQSVLRDCCGGG